MSTSDLAYYLAYRKLSDAECCALVHGHNDDKLPVQRRFETDLDDLTILIHQGIVRPVEGARIPTLDECAIQMGRRAWKHMQRAITEHQAKHDQALARIQAL
jgi:hypothetical protein